MRRRYCCSCDRFVDVGADKICPGCSGNVDHARAGALASGRKLRPADKYDDVETLAALSSKNNEG